jgi:hypothetical protein
MGTAVNMKELLHHWLLSKSASTTKLSPCLKPNRISSLRRMFIMYLEYMEIFIVPTLPQFKALLKQLHYRSKKLRVPGGTANVVLLNAYIVPYMVTHRLNNKSTGRPRNVKRKTDFI